MSDYTVLKNKFNTLVVKTIRGLGAINYEEIDRINVHIALFHGTNGVILWPEYIAVIEEINKYPEIRKHFDCLIGTVESMRAISGSEFVQAFLSWCTWGHHIFDEVDFEAKFESFVSFFNSKNLEFNKECKLFNFSSNLDLLDFDNEVCIKKIPVKREGLVAQMGYEVFSDLGFVMHQKYLVEKLVVTQEESKIDRDRSKDLELFASVTQKINDNFDRVVRAIRIHKHSACYRDHNISTYYTGFFGQFGKSRGSSFLANTAIGQKYEVQSHETDELKAIWRQLKNTDNLGTLSSNRLSYVVERRTKEDRVLDCFIGLESLYLPDGNAELTYRLSLRVAKLLETSKSAQRDTYNFIKAMYSKRSKLAHGKSVEVSDDELNRLEAILRSSVRLYLSDNSKFSDESLNGCFF